MPSRGIALAFAALIAFSGASRAQNDMSMRLEMDRVGGIEGGAYTAGDVQFTLLPYGDKYLLRYAGDPEVYVLYVDSGSLGGRVLKFDSGVTAIRVSGWGGLTIYTDAKPAGLPAARTGDSTPPAMPQASVTDMQKAASDESEHVAYLRKLKLAFTADWNAIAGNDVQRALAFDTLQNTARGIDRFAAVSAARAVFAAKIDGINVEPGARPLISLHGRTLNVTYVAGHGYAGRASSRAIARALGQLLAMPTQG
jgi:Domain of unknown function (DUF4908)